ncbi:hypothetical protein PIB30_088421 [Stylosanthes scabra]|uniref:Uncharacterized protein n=1 Tax=Stylosanthes scabra TaxID=79078 RepID=A0ABU6UWF2_9FABA|nr:hypothetical protein [Stylosanthes scabra]
MPFPNPKGGINVVQTTSDEDTTIDEEEDDEEEEDEEDDEWLYELLAKLAGVESDSEYEYEDAEDKDTAEEDEQEEITERMKETTDKEESSPDKEEEFFIATIYRGNEEKPEELPEKCADPGPCFVTCKVGKIYVSDCLCDLGACASVMSLE